VRTIVAPMLLHTVTQFNADTASSEASLNP
jgi:hypothetical protein